MLLLSRNRARAWRLGCWLLLFSAIAPLATADPAKPGSFRFGVDFTFERMYATRSVADDADVGEIRLVAFVYRPVKNDRHQVVLLSHGSLGGWNLQPKESVHPNPTLLQFFIDRGYTVVAPFRRGVGDSGGNFVEECPYSAGRCTLDEYRQSAETGIDGAIADTDAVLDQVVFGRLVPTGSKVVLAGISRGGFLSVLMAAERPDQVAAVINFVGGWLSITGKWPAAENSERMKVQHRLLGAAGCRAAAPTLWIYGAGDPYYSEATTRAFFAAYLEGGGAGDYLFIANHRQKDGHSIAGELAQWQLPVERYLQSLASPAGWADSPLPAAQLRDNAAVQELLAALAAAIGTNDAAALERIWSSDYQYVGRDGEVLSRQQRLERVRAADAPRVPVSYVRPSIRLHGDTAVITTRVVSRADAEEPSAPLQVTHIAVRRAGQWQIVATQATEIERCAP
jgi:pimeloyl-ACP methyl ester carboxylesterase